MLKAVTTTLLLATSSVAMAETPYGESPYTSPYETPYVTPAPAPYVAPYTPPYTNDYRDDSYANDDGRFRSRAVMLAHNVIVNGRDHRPTWVALDARLGVRRLRIELESGRTFVDSVTIVFADGHRETMDIRQPLSRRNPSVKINLTHPGVQGIFINTSPMRSSVMARGGGWRRDQAAINVVGLRRGR